MLVFNPSHLNELPLILAAHWSYWGTFKNYQRLGPTHPDLTDQGCSLGTGLTMKHAFIHIKGLLFIVFEKRTPKQNQLTHLAKQRGTYEFDG